MIIELNNIKPNYMSEDEVSSSDVYLQAKVIFESEKSYLIRANSGHGKTSILNFIYGSSSNFQGNINYDTISDKKDVFELRRTKISYLFQDFKLFPELTVFENIQLKNALTNYKTQDEIYNLISSVKLDYKKNQLVKSLSLGQKQRVAIVRALCQPFKFLLLDEPFSHLDNENIELVTDIINKEITEQQAGIILTSLDNTYLFKYDKTLQL
jgi:putative ABC transport system ATP-binding protein